MQDRKKDTDVYTRLLDSEGEGEGGMIWENGILTYHQDSMVLAQRQTYRSMEQNKKPRDKSTHIWTPDLRQRRQEYTME